MSNEWVDAIDNKLWAGTKKKAKVPLEQILALAQLSEGEDYLHTLGFIAGLMLEIDGGLTGSDLQRIIKHDRLRIDIRFGRRI